MKKAFVTGSTGLLGNNLVRMLVNKGVKVKALVRSRSKANKQFNDLDIEIIEGDLGNITMFESALAGCDTLFHTAAFFRDNYKGGNHWNELYKVNVEGTKELLQAAYNAGIRRVVHTSSIAVLDGPCNTLIDENMLRAEYNADNYYRSKILADQQVMDFINNNPDIFIALVLPGWMFGPGDLGPTSSGQFILDFVHKKLPGIVPGSFSIVDARDVAAIQIAVVEHGKSGERYLAAGQHMTMSNLLPLVEKVTGVQAPTKNIPMNILKIIASLSEIYRCITGKPILLSKAVIELMIKENNKTYFNHNKSFDELGVSFRPIEETLHSVIQWYRKNNYIK